MINILKPDVEWTSKNIKSFRNIHNITQEAFAAALGTYSSSICRWERGESKPSFFFARRLSEMYRNSEVILVQQPKSYSLDSK